MQVVNDKASHTEENYLKVIFKLGDGSKEYISTNAIATMMVTTAASVTDMLKRLAEKEYINYAKYKGVRLTEKGERVAKELTRKHRLWETFLVDKLGFKWSEVHDLAEELEHINSPELTDKLDDFLGNPQFDPHGDPIPDHQGNIPFQHEKTLADLTPGEKGRITGVGEETVSFLNFLDATGLNLGTKVEVLSEFEFDKSLKIRINEDNETIISNQVSSNLFVEPMD